MEKSINKNLGNKIAKNFNKKYGIITYSGTLALEIALQSLNLSQNSKVLVSDNVCYSIINTILKLKLIPVIKTPENGLYFTDRDIDITLATQNISCILLVHQFGLLNEFNFQKYKQLKIKIIEDVAQAWNIKNNDGVSNIGLYSDIVITSFGRTKPMSYGIGGGLFFNNANIFKLVDYCDNESREKSGILLSYLYPMCNNINHKNLIAIANQNVNQQRLNANMYIDTLSGQSKIKFLKNKGNVWHRFPIWVDNEELYNKIKIFFEDNSFEYQLEHDIKLVDLPICKKCIKINGKNLPYLFLIRTRNVNIENQLEILKKLENELKNI